MLLGNTPSVAAAPVVPVYCNGTIGATTITVPLVVPNGGHCFLVGTNVRRGVNLGKTSMLNVRNAKITGNVTTGEYASLFITNTSVTGNVGFGSSTDRGARRLRITGSTIGGNVTALLAPFSAVDIDSSTMRDIDVFGGYSNTLYQTSVIISSNKTWNIKLIGLIGTADVSYNQINLDLEFTRNRGDMYAYGNTIKNYLRCSNNVPEPTTFSNTFIYGRPLYQCAE